MILPFLLKKLLKTHCQINSEIQESLRLLIKQTFKAKESTNGQQPCWTIGEQQQ